MRYEGLTFQTIPNKTFYLVIERSTQLCYFALFDSFTDKRLVSGTMIVCNEDGEVLIHYAHCDEDTFKKVESLIQLIKEVFTIEFQQTHGHDLLGLNLLAFASFCPVLRKPLFSANSV